MSDLVCSINTKLSNITERFINLCLISKQANQATLLFFQLLVFLIFKMFFSILLIRINIIRILK